MKKFLYYLPRVLSIAIVSFFLLMSFDEPILSVGFLMHNIPTLIILVLLIIFWKNSPVSGAVFLILGVATIFFFNTYQHVVGILVVTMPFFLVSILHFVNYSIKNKKRS